MINRGGEGAGERLLVSLVPMLEKKKRKFSFKLGSAQRYHRLGSEKMVFLWETGRFSQLWWKRCD